LFPRQVYTLRQSKGDAAAFSVFYLNPPLVCLSATLVYRVETAESIISRSMLDLRAQKRISPRTSDEVIVSQDVK